MFKKNKIGFVIVHYGNCENTTNCLKTLSENIDSNSMIIIIDNHSPTPFLLHHPAKNVHLIKLFENNGYSAGVNEGIRYLLKNNFDYIVVLNNDIIFPNESLSPLYEYVNVNNNDNTVLAPILLNQNSLTPQEFGGKLNTFTFYFNNLTQIPNQVTTVNYATGAFLVFPARIFQTLGLFDEQFFMYAEDTDMCYRIKKNNFNILILPAIKILHKMGASSGGVSPLSVYYIHRNRILLSKKHHNFLIHILFESHYSIMILLKSLKWFFKDRKLSKWFILGYLDGLCGHKGKTSREFSG